MKKVLIISNPEDEHTQHVLSKIQDCGGEPFLFFPEKLGQVFSISLNHYANNGQQDIPVLKTNEFENSFSEFYSVWYRRPRLVALQSEGLTYEEIEFAREEWRALIESTYALTRNNLWVSHPDRLREAARKPIQMLTAHQIGFITPRTLITNDPEKSKIFYQECKGKVICKPTGSGWAYSQDGKHIRYVLTNRVNEEYLEAEDEIRIAPVTFQEEIIKSYEVRVNVVGQEVLAIKIDSQKSKVSELDWRRYDLENTPYSKYDLPKEIEQRCLHLTQILGLEFGAIDLIRNQDGDYVFLEINGNGQFLWAEEKSDVKVSNSLALLLSGITKPLKSVTFA